MPSDTIEPPPRDPDGPPTPAAGFFGFEDAAADADVVITGVPFDLTCSFRLGTARGPEAMRRASHQLDLFDLDVGDLRRFRIHTEILTALQRLGANLRPAVDQVRAAHDAGHVPPRRALDDVNAAGAEVFRVVHQRTAAAYAAGQIPVLVGGDHSTSLGALCATLEHDADVGVLHVDAHADMRDAYEGFTSSHASVLHRFARRFPVAPVVSVGLRDISAPEHAAIADRPTHHAVYDPALRTARHAARLPQLLADAIDALPRRVYITWDIDGLEPRYCPGTGTPVPGGLTWDDALCLLATLKMSGREVVGLDLVEVSPGVDASDDEAADGLDALVGARLLYKMIGTALGTRRAALR